MEEETAKLADDSTDSHVEKFLSTTSSRLGAEAEDAKELVDTLASAGDTSEAALAQIHRRLDARTNWKFSVQIPNNTVR